MSDGIEHGTYAGAQEHRRRGEPLAEGNSACEPCRIARNDYAAMWRRHSTSPAWVEARDRHRAENRARFRLAQEYPNRFEVLVAEELEK